MKFIAGETRISYGGAVIDQREKDAINAVINAHEGKMWTLGEQSTLFERELAQKTGVAHAVVVNSGSSALLTALTALHLPKGSKIIIPALNFPTAYASILQAGHIPVVVDVDQTTLNIDAEQVKIALLRHPEVKAVVAVHIAGNVVDLITLRKIVGDRIIISDNCDGYGGMLDGKFIDTYADISCISMHAAHIITMGEGGAILTDNEEYANRSRKIREWGRASGSDKLTTHEGLPADYRERYVYEEVGYNFKPLELQCAMGRVQLTKLEEFKAKRAHNFERLYKGFGKTKFMLPSEEEGSDNCWFGFPVLTEERRRAMDYFESKNIETRTIFSGNVLRHPAYKSEPHIQIGDLEISDYIMGAGMFLSVHPLLTDEMIDFMIQTAKEL